MHLSVFSLLTLVSVTAAAVLDPRALPTPVSAATARFYLASCRLLLTHGAYYLMHFMPIVTVEAESNTPVYDRSLFKHWITSRQL
jgi:hypothetical protein